MEKEKTGRKPDEDTQKVAGSPAGEPQPVEGGERKPDEDINPYEEELKKAQEELAKKTAEKENLHKALVSEREKNKQQAPKKQDDDEIKRAEQFVVERARKVFEPELEQLRQEMTATSRKALLSQMSSDPKEQELIEFHLDNSVTRSGDLQSDLKKAWILANAYKVEQATQKRVDDAHHRSVQANDAAALAGGYSSGGNYEVDNTKISKEDLALAKKFGLSEKEFREKMKS